MKKLKNLSRNNVNFLKYRINEEIRFKIKKLISGYKITLWHKNEHKKSKYEFYIDKDGGGGMPEEFWDTEIEKEILNKINN